MRSLFRHIRHSLSMKLSFGILLLTVLVFVVSLGVLFVESRHHIKQEAVELATSILNTSEQRMRRYLNTVETATDATEWLVLENMHPDSLLAFSNRVVMLNGNVNGCSITTEPYLFPKYGRFFSAYSVRQGDSVVTVREESMSILRKYGIRPPKSWESPVGWILLMTIIQVRFPQRA